MPLDVLVVCIVCRNGWTLLNPGAMARVASSKVVILTILFFIRNRDIARVALRPNIYNYKINVTLTPEHPSGHTKCYCFAGLIFYITMQFFGLLDISNIFWFDKDTIYLVRGPVNPVRSNFIIMIVTNGDGKSPAAFRFFKFWCFIKWTWKWFDWNFLYKRLALLWPINIMMYNNIII